MQSESCYLKSILNCKQNLKLIFVLAIKHFHEFETFGGRICEE